MKRATTLWVSCSLAIIASACSFFVKEPPDAVVELKALGWTVNQLDDDFELSKPGCSNADLTDLVRFGPQLEDIHLDLEASNVTDDGLLTLASLPNIVELNAGDLAVEDHGLGVVANWPELTLLNASGTGLTDNGLAALRELTALEVLILDGCTRIRGAGLSHIVSRDLAYLDLSNTSIDDEGFLALPVMPELTVIVLEQTNLSDKSLDHLSQFELLEEVYVFGVTGLSQAAISRLENSPSAPVIVLAAKGTG